MPASMKPQRAALETVTDLVWTRCPVMRFYPGNELAGDASNWFGPNPPAVLGMLQAAGFSRAQIVSRRYRPLDLRVVRAILKRHLYKPFWPAIQNDRIVVHAWR